MSIKVEYSSVFTFHDENTIKRVAAGQRPYMLWGDDQDWEGLRKACQEWLDKNKPLSIGAIVKEKENRIPRFWVHEGDFYFTSLNDPSFRFKSIKFDDWAELVWEPPTND